MPASKYTVEIAREICRQLAEGVPLREICRQDGMPEWRTIYDWMVKDDAAVAAGGGAGLSASIARAREIGYDAIAEDCLRIADDASNDWMETEHGPRLNAEHVQRSKLRIETRLKLLAKWNPKKYGERVQVAGDADAPLKVEAELNAEKLLKTILEHAQLTRQADQA
jgi:hypothetical protein